MKKKTFVLSDEKTRNSFGFYVKTEGISLERFTGNPIMLNNHRNDTKDVLGTWSDVRKENGQLLATPDFDTEDANGKEVVRKVLNGKIKGASIGIQFNKEDLKLNDGKLVLERCELMEASIVAVPSNANAISLYAPSGELLTQEEVKEICLSTKKSVTPKIEIMNKEILEVLGLSADAETIAVEEAIKATVSTLSAVTAERDTLKKQVEDFETAEATRQSAELEALIEKSVKEGKINADAKQDYVSLGLSVAKKVLAGIPARKPVAPQVNSEESKLSAYDKMSWDKLDRENCLEKLKLEHNAYYCERFKKEFGKEPK